MNRFIISSTPLKKSALPPISKSSSSTENPTPQSSPQQSQGGLHEPSSAPSLAQLKLSLISINSIGSPIFNSPRPSSCPSSINAILPPILHPDEEVKTEDGESINLRVTPLKSANSSLSDLQKLYSLSSSITSTIPFISIPSSPPTAPPITQSSSTYDTVQSLLPPVTASSLSEPRTYFVTATYSSTTPPEKDYPGLKNFIASLIDLKMYGNKPSNLLTRKKNPIGRFNYESVINVYVEGMTKLTSYAFENSDDADLALKIVVQRAFRVISVTHKNTYKNSLTFRCSKMESTNDEEDSEYKLFVKEFFSEGFSFIPCKCAWNAVLAYNEPTKRYYFNSITPLYCHVSGCFRGTVHNPLILIDFGKDRLDIRMLSTFNKLLSEKVGIIISPESIRRHFNHIRNKELKDAQYPELPEHPELDKEDQKVIQTLDILKLTGVLQDFDYSVSGETIDFLAFISREQVEVVAKFGDLIFIDGTYKTNNEKYILLNFVVTDDNNRSIIGATAFTKAETIDAYTKFLKFIRKNVPFKRLPLCLISDGAQAIHKAVADTFPYARHIYCAFHLIREDKKFVTDKPKKSDRRGRQNTTPNTDPQEQQNTTPNTDSQERQNITPNTDSQEQEKSAKKAACEDQRMIIKYYINCMLITTSINRINEIVKILEGEMDKEGSLIAKDVIERIIGHAINGARPYQDVFTGGAVSSSRVEGMNSLLKRQGMCGSTPFIEAVTKCVYLSMDQMNARNIIRNKIWYYADDNDFLNFFNEDIGVSDGVLESMYREFLLSISYSYKVSPCGSGELLIVTREENALAKVPQYTEVDFINIIGSDEAKLFYE